MYICVREMQGVLDDEVNKRREAETMIEALQVCVRVWMYTIH
jgi:hypothetical protein